MKGRVAFITGASRGVGAAVARSFHEAGAQVALASRSGDDLGLDGARGLQCDVRDPGSVQQAVDATVTEFGGRGHMKSAILGALVILSIDNGLGLLGLGSGEKFVITGGVLLLAVTVDSISRRGRAQSGRA